MVLGPDSSLAPIILAILLPLSVGDPARAVALAGMMAIVSGIVCILAGVFRLGFITELLSNPSVWLYEWHCTYGADQSNPKMLGSLLTAVARSGICILSLNQFWMEKQIWLL
jgi:hypothetical protein